MPHHSPLVSTIVVGLVLAFAFGAVAHRLKASPLVGYLLAGVVVLVLVFLPVLAVGANLSAAIVPLAITLGKFAAFVGLMWFVGRRVIPWLLHYVAHTGSRELFRLAVLAIALGVAYGAATLFDVSLALGAFFAGMILSESTLSQRAAQETLPLRAAFAVLFFVRGVMRC